MDQTTLVDRLQSEGRRLTDVLLRDEKLGLTASFWWSDPETGVWRLILASALYRTAGPKKTYDRIGRALDKLTPKRVAQGPISLGDITAVADTDPRVVAIASGVRAEQSVVRISSSMLNGVYVHDAVAYQLTVPEAQPEPTKDIVTPTDVLDQRLTTTLGGN